MISSQQLVLNALTRIKEVSVIQLAKLKLKCPVNLIDIREADEVEGGVIPESVWIPRGVLEFNVLSVIEKLNWNECDEIYLCCRSGKRSVLAAVSLLEMGFKNPISIAGGFNAWKESGFQISKEVIDY